MSKRITADYCEALWIVSFRHTQKEFTRCLAIRMQIAFGIDELTWILTKCD